MQRREFIEKSAIASGMLLSVPVLSYSDVRTENNFPLLDFHVHTTPEFTMKNIMVIGERNQG